MRQTGLCSRTAGPQEQNTHNPPQAFHDQSQWLCPLPLHCPEGRRTRTPLMQKWAWLEDLYQQSINLQRDKSVTVLFFSVTTHSLLKESDIKVTFWNKTDLSYTSGISYWCQWCAFFLYCQKEKKKHVPKLCCNVVNLLLVLQDLLTVSLKQQGGHTQAVGVKAFELVIEAVDSCLMKTTRGRYWRWRLIWTYLIYLSDIKLLQTIQERCENGRHLRLQSMTCDMKQESERSLRNRFS